VLPAADGRGVGVTWRRLERIVYTVLRAACPGRQGAWIAAGDLPPMAAFSLAAAGWAAGAAVTEGFAVEAIPALVETLAPGVVWTTPAALAQLLRGLPAGFRARPDWRVLCCGEGLDPDVARQARLDLTPDVHLLYGPAEAAVTAIGPAADLEALPGLAGVVPSDTEVTIMGSDGEPVAPGEVGELLIAGPRVAGGYVDDAAATVERFPGGRFRTGQPARHLADGRLILEGRA
jgi:non-ribosomal peptide synthetase component F